MSVAVKTISPEIHNTINTIVLHYIPVYQRSRTHTFPIGGGNGGGVI